MALIPIAKNEREKVARMKSEVYSAGDEYGRKTLAANTFNRIEEGLKDYCTIETHSKYRGTMGGNIPNRSSSGHMETTEGEIALDIKQKFEQPGAYLSYMEATLKYDPEVSEADMDIVRRVLKDTGLTAKI